MDVGTTTDLVKAITWCKRRWQEGADLASKYEAAGIASEVVYIFERLGDLALHVEEIERVLLRLCSDTARQRIVSSYAEDIRREAIDERKRVLGDGAALTILSEQDVRDLARVQRAWTYLDPEDLTLLRDLWKPPDLEPYIAELCHREGEDPRGNSLLGERRVEMLRDGHLEGANLFVSGCVRSVRRAEVEAKTWIPEAGAVRETVDAIEITPIGMLVLGVMGHTPLDPD